MGVVAIESKGFVMRRLTAFLFCLIFLVCTACSGRDTSTPAKALIGQWEIKEGKMFFLPHGIWFMIPEDGERIFGAYKIMEQNVPKFTMRIDLAAWKKDLTAEAAASVTFSKDFREMKWVWPQVEGGPSHYKYIDSKL